MSKSIDILARGYLDAARACPEKRRAIYQDAARTFLGHAENPVNAGIAPALLGWASRFAAAASRPATMLDFEDELETAAEAYYQVGDPLDDMAVVARAAEIHEARQPVPRVAVIPKSVNQRTQLGNQATIKLVPTDADKSAGIRPTQTIALWQGEPEEAQAVTVDTAVVDQPADANLAGGPRPYQILTYGGNGAVVNVRMDVGQRVTIPCSFVSVLVGMNPQLTDFTKGQLTVMASVGFFAAPSLAPVILTEYADDVEDGQSSRLIPRPIKAMYLQPVQSNLLGGAATLNFYALDGAIPRYVVPYVNGAQNVPIPLAADIAFVQVMNTNGGGFATSFRLPFQLSL